MLNLIKRSIIVQVYAVKKVCFTKSGYVMYHFKSYIMLYVQKYHDLKMSHFKSRDSYILKIMGDQITW